MNQCFISIIINKIIRWLGQGIYQEVLETLETNHCWHGQKYHWLSSMFPAFIIDFIYVYAHYTTQRKSSSIPKGQWLIEIGTHLSHEAWHTQINE
jgi:hypothetical protein